MALSIRSQILLSFNIIRFKAALVYSRVRTLDRAPLKIHRAGMKLLRAASSLVPVLYASPTLCGQTAPTGPTAEETRAFDAIKELKRKSRQGGDAPTEQDLAERRSTGMALAKQGRAFLKNHPASAQAEDARALAAIGLYEAALAGDSTAAKELEDFASQAVNDPKVPDMLKLHAFALNHLAQKGAHGAKGSLNQGSAEFQIAYADAFFAAAGVLSNKDSIFKMLLLQAKSGRELSGAEKRSIAERVLSHPGASAAIKAEAEKVVSGNRTVAVGKPLDISFTAVDGRKVDLKDMKGKVVLIDFWATWCGPCIAEIPNLKKAYERFHSQGFEIVGISLDDRKSDLVAFTKKHEMPWPEYFDGQHWNNEISFRFGINSVPTQWLVDKKGNLHARPDLAGAVERLLNEE